MVEPLFRVAGCIIGGHANLGPIGKVMCTGVDRQFWLASSLVSCIATSVVPTVLRAGGLTVGNTSANPWSPPSSPNRYLLAAYKKLTYLCIVLRIQ